MELVRRLVGSSIGRKWLMALTGFGLLGFLSVHLLGNLTIYGGSGAFNTYAEKLHSVGPVLYVVELGLLAVALVHICFAGILIVENLRARERYKVKRAEGGRTWASRSMLVSGPYILVFVVFHLLHFTFIDKGDQQIAAIVAARFAQPLWAAFYGFSMLLVGLHVSHGLWSAFQTLGVETRTSGKLRKLALLASILLALGFASLPAVVHSVSGLLN